MNTNSFKVHFFIFSLRFVWLEETQRRSYLPLHCEIFYFILNDRVSEATNKKHEIREVWFLLLLSHLQLIMYLLSASMSSSVEWE